MNICRAPGWGWFTLPSVFLWYCTMVIQECLGRIDIFKKQTYKLYFSSSVFPLRCFPKPRDRTLSLSCSKWTSYKVATDCNNLKRHCAKTLNAMDSYRTMLLNFKRWNPWSSKVKNNQRWLKHNQEKNENCRIRLFQFLLRMHGQEREKKSCIRPCSHAIENRQEDSRQKGTAL